MTKVAVPPPQAQLPRSGPILALLTSRVSAKNEAEDQEDTKPQAFAPQGEETVDVAVPLRADKVFSFKMRSHFIMDAVHFRVQLVQQHKDLGLNSIYNFTTRYSKLLRLHQALQEEGGRPPPFPPKLWWGNTSPEAIAQRKRELEHWLNAALPKIIPESKVAERFISQIIKECPETFASTLAL